MLHEISQWNWSGLAFVAGMGTMLLLSGWATERLRRWAERPQEPKEAREVEPWQPAKRTPLPSPTELAMMRSVAERGR